MGEIKLDAYDKKILGRLLENSREQVSSIGNNIRMRRENVNYRINRMVKEGLITGFNTIFDEKAIGLQRYVIFLQMIKITEEKEEELLNFIKANPYMTWASPAAGKWSLIFDILIPEGINLDDIIKEMFVKFGDFIGDYVLLQFQDHDYFDYKLLDLQKTVKNRERVNKKIRLDEKDKEILSMLNENARTSYVEIAGKVKLTANGVHNRVRNLEKKGFIVRYTISIDWKKLGYEWYGLQFNLVKFGEDIEMQLKNYLSNHERVIFYNRYLGGAWDYDIGIVVKDSNELRDFINEIRSEFSDSIKINDVFIVLEESAGYKFPRGCLRA